MTTRTTNASEKRLSCLDSSVKAVLSFGFINAARFFSALRFYFYNFICAPSTI